MALIPHFDYKAKSGPLGRRLMLCIHKEPNSCQVAHGFSRVINLLISLAYESKNVEIYLKL